MCLSDFLSAGKFTNCSSFTSLLLLFFSFFIIIIVCSSTFTTKLLSSTTFDVIHFCGGGKLLFTQKCHHQGELSSSDLQQGHTSI